MGFFSSLGTAVILSRLEQMEKRIMSAVSTAVTNILAAVKKDSDATATELKTVAALLTQIANNPTDIDVAGLVTAADTLNSNADNLTTQSATVQGVIDQMNKPA